MNEREMPGGFRLRWRDEGHGSPLLLVSGLGATSVSWDPLISHIATPHRRILPENRGAFTDDGSSGDLSIARLAEDAVATLDAAGVGSAHVAGNSLGGMIAQEIALRHPDRVRSLVLMATSPGVPCVPASPRFAWHLARAATTAGQDRERHLSACFLGRPEIPLDAAERGDQGGLSTFAITDGHRRQLRAALRWNSLRRLRRLDVPTLVVHGARDRLLPPVNGRLLARLVPGARLVLLRDAGHFFITEAADEAAVAVDDFLAEVERGTLARGACFAPAGLPVPA